ncbi:ABC transporter permease [Kineosporia succinea]|uniref:ABC-2 type transport system permease protein n=1 Tax=Kineosporia succinea TaxID=84632 RepID=A0ABT9PAC2_9ACTN|nr:ABC-2 family transporter protein [Kineosporia succinea]MDP9829629.1 ABC-2 type transport system permease protein [Kineosporia succinea]
MAEHSRLRPYRVLLGARVRAQSSYRASFGLDLLTSLLIGLVELAEVWVLYRSVDGIGGLDLTAALLVFGLADTAFSIADLVVGHLDTLPQYLRAGTFDVFCLRPQPLLAQLVTSDISLRRLTRVAVGITVLTGALITADVPLTPENALLLLLALVAGTLICAGIFVAAAGAQFFLVDASEMTNAIVYGGRYASTHPAAVWSRPLVALFGFGVPMAFAGYLPTLTLLDLPTPWNLPGWAGWLAPLAALWTAVVAGLSWRLGTRHYQGGGG